MNRQDSDRVLITGSSGFVGRKLAERYPNAMCPRLDLADRTGLYAFVRESQPDVVFHLAARVDSSSDRAVMEDCAQTNALGTLHLIEALSFRPPRVIVYVSTTAVYGDGPIPSVETQQERPLTAYAATKLAGEHLCRVYERTHGVPVAIARLATVYGPGQKRERFIPSVIRALVLRKPIALGTGSQKRDFVYLDDAVSGIATMADFPGETVNLGHDDPVSWREIADKIHGLVGSGGAALQWGKRPDRKDEPLVSASSGKKAEKLLGWRPTTPLTVGLQRTIAEEAEKL